MLPDAPGALRALQGGAIRCLPTGASLINPSGRTARAIQHNVITIPAFTRVVPRMGVLRLNPVAAIVIERVCNT